MQDKLAPSIKRRCRTIQEQVPLFNLTLFWLQSETFLQGSTRCTRTERSAHCAFKLTWRQIISRASATVLPTLSLYSHSIVAGGFPEMSYTTRLMPRTSLMMRFDTRPSRSYGNWAQCAVMKSWVCTARKATT